MSGADPEWLATLRAERARPVPEASWGRVVGGIWPRGSLRRVEPLVGGLGGLLDRVHAEDARGNPVSAVVRRFMPEWGETPEDVTGEIATLEVLAAHDVPAPRTLWSDATGAVLGRPALAMTDLRGRAAAAGLSVETAGLVGELLARLHRVPGPAMRHRPAPGTLTAQVGRELARSRPQDGDYLDRQVLHAALEGAVRRIPGQRETFLHDDFHPGNVLVDGTVTSVVDLSWATRGDPGRDVGYCRLDLALTGVPGTTEAFLAAYEAAGGVVPEHLWLYDLVAALRSLPTPAQWLPAFHEQGRADLTPGDLVERARSFVDGALEHGRAAGVLGTLDRDGRGSGSG